jgi:hypothetical protein
MVPHAFNVHAYQYEVLKMLGHMVCGSKGNRQMKKTHEHFTAESVNYAHCWTLQGDLK